MSESATDIDGDDLVFTLESNALNGLVTIEGSIATYTPNSNYNGNDTFTFNVSDGEFSSSASIDVSINPVNDAPSLILDSPSVEFNEDESTSIAFTATDLSLIHI